MYLFTYMMILRRRKLDQLLIGFMAQHANVQGWSSVDQRYRFEFNMPFNSRSAFCTSLTYCSTIVTSSGMSQPCSTCYTTVDQPSHVEKATLVINSWSICWLGVTCWSISWPTMLFQKITCWLTLAYFGSQAINSCLVCAIKGGYQVHQLLSRGVELLQG